MDEEGFRQFMKKQHRSQGTMDSCVAFARVFAEYLNTHFDQIELNEAQPDQLDAFLAWGKGKFSSMNSHLWAISRYYEYTGNGIMHRYANQIRIQKIEKKRLKRPSLLLKEIEGIKSNYIDALENIGITNICKSSEHLRQKVASAKRYFPDPRLLYMHCLRLQILQASCLKGLLLDLGSPGQHLLGFAGVHIHRCQVVQ